MVLHDSQRKGRAQTGAMAACGRAGAVEEDSMRRVVAPVLLALAIVGSLLAQAPPTPVPATFAPTAPASPAPAPTTPYARLYVFGDSYSDIGAGYIDGNGPTAVAYLGWLMGLQVASSKTTSAGWQEPRVRGERRGHG